MPTPDAPTPEPSATTRPCAMPREQFYCRGRCHCGVLMELHTEDGWRAYHERQAQGCELVAKHHEQRARDLRASAEACRSKPFPLSSEVSPDA